MSRYLQKNSLFTRKTTIFRALLGVVFLSIGCACAGSSKQCRDSVSATSVDKETTKSSPTRLDTLGTFENVPVQEVTEPHTEMKIDSGAKPPRPIRIRKGAQPRPYALKKGDLILPSGLTIHEIPKRTEVRVVPEQQTGRRIWEIVDKRRRRSALIRALSWREVVLEGGQTPTQNTRPIRLRERRRDWGPDPVAVIVERFSSNTHVYTLERRAIGTDWIVNRLEIELTD